MDPQARNPVITVLLLGGFAAVVLINTTTSGTAPAWMVRSAPILNDLAILVAVLIVFAGLAYVVTVWNERRDTLRPSANALDKPPGSLPPALAGLLIEGGVQPQHITATLLDLGRRGALTIEEKGGTLYYDRVEGYTGRLRDFEEKLLTGLFGDRTGAITTEQVNAALGVTVEPVGEAIRQELTVAGLLTDQPHPLIHYRGEIAMVGFVLGAVGVMTLFRFTDVVRNIWMPFAALSLVSVMLLGTDNDDPQPLTWKGRQTARRWDAYRRSMLSGVPNDMEVFRRQYPYAIAFGQGRRYARQAPSQGVSPALSEHLYEGLNAGAETLFEALDGTARTLAEMPIMRRLAPKRPQTFTRAKVPAHQRYASPAPSLGAAGRVTPSPSGASRSFTRSTGRSLSSSSSSSSSRRSSGSLRRSSSSSRRSSSYRRPSSRSFSSSSSRRSSSSLRRSSSRRSSSSFKRSSSSRRSSSTRKSSSIRRSSGSFKRR